MQLLSECVAFGSGCGDHGGLFLVLFDRRTLNCEQLFGSFVCLDQVVECDICRGYLAFDTSYVALDIGGIECGDAFTSFDTATALFDKFYTRGKFGCDHDVGIVSGGCQVGQGECDIARFRDHRFCDDGVDFCRRYTGGFGFFLLDNFDSCNDQQCYNCQKDDYFDNFFHFTISSIGLV